MHLADKTKLTAEVSAPAISNAYYTLLCFCRDAHHKRRPITTSAHFHHPNRTYEQRQEFEDGLALLLRGVSAGGAEHFLGDILGCHQPDRQHKVADGVIPAQGRGSILELEQPAEAASLQCTRGGGKPRH